MNPTNRSTISAEEAKKASLDELFRKLSTSENGLSSSEAKERLLKVGSNEIIEERIHPVIKFLRYFWGPYHG